MTFTLYDFQEEALAAEARHRAEHPDETRLAVVLPTGTGKAYTLCARAVRYLDSFDGAGNRVLIIAHTDELVDQLRESAEFVAGQWPTVDGAVYRVGVVKADRDDVDADIIIASRQTLEIPARREQIRNVGLVIVDECHIGYTAYMPIMRHFGALPVHHYDEGPYIPALGFTATLERSDRAGLGQVWQNVAFTRDISWAVRKGYLVQPVGLRLEIDPGAQYGRSWAADASVLDAQMSDSIAPDRVVEEWLAQCGTRVQRGRNAFFPTILFAPLVRSADAFRNAFRRAGITAETIHGDMPKALRRQYIARFKAGRIEVLCNAMVLTAGFDHPGVECVIVARPTKSRTLFVQMAGRGLRRKPGVPVEDQSCLIMTVADSTTDLCSIADLSDRPLDRTADGPLTAMEDEWDIGKSLEEVERHWAGRVSATQFDPIVSRSSKVWRQTKGGRWFLPISGNREYVFLVNASIYVLTRPEPRSRHMRIERIGSAPDVELAMRLAEDEATERGGDLGALLADRTRPWRNQRPSEKMLTVASRMGLDGEVARIMNARTGGKAGKVSDLIGKVEASGSIDKAATALMEREEA